MLVHFLVNIILVFGRNNDRYVQRIVNGRFSDRMWAYLCISSTVLKHIRSRNTITELFRTLHCDCICKMSILRRLWDLTKTASGPTNYRTWLETLISTHKHVHTRSQKRQFTIHCTFWSLLRPKTKIKFIRDWHGTSLGI